MSTFRRLIADSMGLDIYCTAGSGCGRHLDADVYDAAELMGLDTTYIRARLPMRCRECGNRNVSFKLAIAPRRSEFDTDDTPPHMRMSRTPAEVERVRAMVEECRRAHSAVI